MQSMVIAGYTARLGAPPGLESEVRPLFIKRVGDCMVSRWEPSPSELALLNAGGSVDLWVLGTNHPPVSLVVSPPHSDLPERR